MKKMVQTLGLILAAVLLLASCGGNNASRSAASSGTHKSEAAEVSSETAGTKTEGTETAGAETSGTEAEASGTKNEETEGSESVGRKPKSDNLDDLKNEISAVDFMYLGMVDEYLNGKLPFAGVAMAVSYTNSFFPSAIDMAQNMKAEKAYQEALINLYGLRTDSFAILMNYEQRGRAGGLPDAFTVKLKQLVEAGEYFRGPNNVFYHKDACVKIKELIGYKAP